MITNRIKELEDQVARLQAQLKHEKEKFIDWDNLTLDELKELFSHDSFFEGDQDEVLYHLGQLTGLANRRSWPTFIYHLREAVKLYLREQL